MKHILIFILTAFSICASAQKKLSVLPIGTVDTGTTIVTVKTTSGVNLDCRVSIADLAAYIGSSSSLTLLQVTTNGDTTTKKMVVIGTGRVMKTVHDTASYSVINGAGIKLAELTNSGGTSGQFILRNSTGGQMILLPGAITGTVGLIGPAIGGTLETVMNFNTSATDANFIISGSQQTYVLPAITANRTVTMSTATVNATMRICNRNTTGNNWQIAGSLVLDNNGVAIVIFPSPCTFTLQGDGTNWVVVSK